MDTYPPDAWERLGNALELRRIQLGYSQRRRFARARGSAGIEKTLARLERGDRGAYLDSTLAEVEAMYALAPGSIKDHLGGGRFTPLADPGAVTGLTEDEVRTVRAFVEVLRRNREAGNTEERPA